MTQISPYLDATEVTRFCSDDHFEVISYYASHGLLLLKSKPTNTSGQCMHLLFQDVRAIEIRFWFDGLSVIERDLDYLAQFASKPTEMMEIGLKVYELRSTAWRGYVVGGIFRSVEARPGKLYESPLIGELPPIFLGQQTH